MLSRLHSAPIRGGFSTECWLKAWRRWSAVKGENDRTTTVQNSYERNATNLSSMCTVQCGGMEAKALSCVLAGIVVNITSSQGSRIVAESDERVAESGEVAESGFVREHAGRWVGFHGLFTAIFGSLAFAIIWSRLLFWQNSSIYALPNFEMYSEKKTSPGFDWFHVPKFGLRIFSSSQYWISVLSYQLWYFEFQQVSFSLHSDFNGREAALR